MFRPLPAPPSQPLLKESETLFCSPGIRASCLVAGDPDVYLLSEEQLTPRERENSKSEIFFNLSS